MPETFVKNGRPVFGTFRGHPKRLDIRGIFRPFGVIPLPVFITNLRIKSRLTFSFNLPEYVGHIYFIDAKICGFAEIVFWNKSTSQKLVYHCFMGPRRRFIPHNLDNAFTSNYMKKRYVRISWDRGCGKLSVIFNLKGDDVRPTATGTFISSFDDSSFSEVTIVKPNPTKRRAAAEYDACLSLKGAVSLLYSDGTMKNSQTADGISFFDITRTYMRFHSHGEFVLGFGIVMEKFIAFKICADSDDASNTDLYNSNVLFYDGKMTPLPPARITHSYGISKSWVIQDTENMIDLTFNSKSVNVNKISAFIVRTVNHTIYGTFEGSVVTSEGQKISFKSLQGISENYLVRL